MRRKVIISAIENDVCRDDARCITDHLNPTTPVYAAVRRKEMRDETQDMAVFERYESSMYEVDGSHNFRQSSPSHVSFVTRVLPCSTYLPNPPPLEDSRVRRVCQHHLRRRNVHKSRSAKPITFFPVHGPPPADIVLIAGVFFLSVGRRACLLLLLSTRHSHTSPKHRKPWTDTERSSAGAATKGEG